MIPLSVARGRALRPEPQPLELPGKSVEGLMAFVASQDAPCPKCGYNLRGLVGPCCPECGLSMSDIEMALRWRAPRLRRKWQRLIAITMLGWAGGLVVMYLGIRREMRADALAGLGFLLLIPSAGIWLLSIPTALCHASKCFGSAKSWRASTYAALVVAVPTLGLGLLGAVASLIE